MSIARRFCPAACPASPSRPASPTTGANTSARSTTRPPPSSVSTGSANRRRPPSCSSISDSPSTMSSPPSAASLADASGIVLRRAAPRDAEAIARVRVDGWRTAYRGLVPAAYLDGMRVDANTALWEKILTAGPNSASVFIAAHDGEVVGFAAANRLAETRYGLDAELTAVYLRREFQRVGIGRRLIAEVVEAQRAQGATGMIVWVLAANKPARALYERLGAELLVEQEFQWDGMDLLEVGYGWRDLDALAAACRAGQALPQAESPKQDRRAGR